jgi:hypothetical protein
MIASIWFFVWFDGVVPFAMERMMLDFDCSQFGFGDFDAAWIARAIDSAGNGESFVGRGRSDQLYDDFMASGLPRQFWVM